jgi:hypothetical protein
MLPRASSPRMTALPSVIPITGVGSKEAIVLKAFFR